MDYGNGDFTAEHVHDLAYWLEFFVQQEPRSTTKTNMHDILCIMRSVDKVSKKKGGTQWLSQLAKEAS